MTPLVTWSGYGLKIKDYLYVASCIIFIICFLIPYQNIMYLHFLALPPDTSCG